MAVSATHIHFLPLSVEFAGLLLGGLDPYWLGGACLRHSVKSPLRFPKLHCHQWFLVIYE